MPPRGRPLPMLDVVRPQGEQPFPTRGSVRQPPWDPGSLRSRASVTAPGERMAWRAASLR